MGTFKNTPASKADLVKELDTEATPSYTDVVSRERNKAVDRSEQNKLPAKKSVRQAERSS